MVWYGKVVVWRGARLGVTCIESLRFARLLASISGCQLDHARERRNSLVPEPRSSTTFLSYSRTLVLFFFVQTVQYCTAYSSFRSSD